MKNPTAVLSFFNDKRRICKDRIREEATKRKNDPKMLFKDLFFFFTGFLFARTHLYFGAYPLGIAWLCALPYGVYTSLAGCVIGAFSMGKRGIVYAMIYAIAVLMRLFLSVSDAKNAGKPKEQRFLESPMLRSSFAVISGFIGGGYEVLLNGLTLPAVIYAAAMMLTAGVAAFLFSFLFAEDFPDALFRSVRPLPLSSKKGLAFSGALGVTLFLLSYSLLPFSVAGISLSYLLTGFLTLFFASRYGGVPAMAAGFLCALPGGASAAVAFALAGAAAGFLFSFGLLYALLGGGAALILWSGYTEGMTGFLSVFPEYALAASLGFPAWRKYSASVPKPGNSATKTAEDMVGAMALSYRANAANNQKKISQLFRSLVPILNKMQKFDHNPEEEEYKETVCEVLLHSCYDCSHRDLCGTAGIQNLVRGLTAKSLRGEALSQEDMSFCDKDDDEKQQILYYLSLRIADLSSRDVKRAAAPSYADLCSAVSRLLEEAQTEAECGVSLDTALSESLEKVLTKHGLPDGVVRVYGNRIKTVVAAAEDAGGRKITSPDLFKSLEEAVGASLSAPSYYRQKEMVLLECKTRKKYGIRAFAASQTKNGKEPSGDSYDYFEDESGKYYLVLSDGMGSGAEAKTVSRFSSDYLREMMSAGCSEHSSLYLLNSILRGQGDECSTTVDLCEVDLFSGHAAFYKSGAAPSFLKRKDKIYRVRSETVPIGILPTLDTEKIHVETKEGDVIIMFSDGVSTSPEDAPWLSGFLSGELPASMEEYANSILEETIIHNKRRDDISVIVAQIVAA